MKTLKIKNLFKMSGWIKLHRKITDNPLYFSEQFNRSMAWIDLLLLANYADNYFFKRGVRVDVKTGQVGYDLDSLAKRWKWSRGKVERFLKMLENDNQIVRQKNNVTTLISIVNYKEYQQDDKANNKPNSKADENKQESKEIKKVFKRPSIEEINTFCLEHNLQLDSQSFLDYYDSNGWKVGKNNMKDWKATVRRWAKPQQTVIFEEPKELQILRQYAKKQG